MTFARPPAADDPDWPRASDWLAGADGTTPAAGAPRMRVVGVPSSVGSISPSQAWRTPAAVRSALARMSTWDPVAGLDVRAAVEVVDLGDWDVADLDLEAAMAAIRDRAGALDPDDADLDVFLGGDNAVTRPIVVGALGPDLHDVGLVTLDAHHDVRSLEGGPRNGTPVRGLLADGLPGRNVWQVGIAPFANSPVHARWAADRGITAVTAREVAEDGIDHVVGRALADLDHVRAIHVDLDVDVLDAAFAPACPGARPGGLRPGDLFAAARSLAAHPRVRSVDLVEVDAATDRDGRTVLATAMALLHLAAGLARRSGRIA